MTRIGWVLAALLSVLLGVGWFFLVYSPTSENIEDVRSQTDQALSEAQSQRARAQTLRQIRAEAPEAEAALALGRSIVPDDPAIPALFRQMQQAADDSGVRMPGISPSAPTTVDLSGEEVTAISVTMSVEGSYFQLVDLARRIEDPSITPRGLRWQSASLATGEYPTLNATLSGTVYARSGLELPVALEDPAAEADGEVDAPDDADSDAEADLTDDEGEVE